MLSPGRTSPPVSTIAITPALRIRPPCSSRSSTAGRQQARLKAIQLHAWIAKAGDLRHGGSTEVEPRADREAEKVYTARGDVFSHLPGRHGEAYSLQLVVEFGPDQVQLAQVGLRGVLRHPRAMLDRAAHVGITLDTQPRKQPYAGLPQLAEGVPCAVADRRHHCSHSLPQ